MDVNFDFFNPGFAALADGAALFPVEDSLPNLLPAIPSANTTASTNVRDEQWRDSSTVVQNSLYNYPDGHIPLYKFDGSDVCSSRLASSGFTPRNPSNAQFQSWPFYPPLPPEPQNQGWQAQSSVANEGTLDVFATDSLLEPAHMFPQSLEFSALPYSDSSILKDTGLTTQTTVAPTTLNLDIASAHAWDLGSIPKPFTAPRRHSLRPITSTTTRDYVPEKPRRDSKKNWIRTNSNTQGKSSRTGKINNYRSIRDGGYLTQTLHPTLDGRWHSQEGTNFTYNVYGELQQLTFTGYEIQQFLSQHPTGVTLWIQKTPADSARRYATKYSSKCRFADCPAKDFGRSITVGHIRVAFDEQWGIYGAERDPFCVAGYVHLYCLERFCDFAAICALCDVRAENRVLYREPRGVFSASLGKTQEFSLAMQFVADCKQGCLASTWPDYPSHFWMDPENEYTATLCYSMTNAKNRSAQNSRKNQLRSRGLKESNLYVNVGDIEVQTRGRRATYSKSMLGKRGREITSDSKGHGRQLSYPDDSRIQKRCRTSEVVVRGLQTFNPQELCHNLISAHHPSFVIDSKVASAAPLQAPVANMERGDRLFSTSNLESVLKTPTEDVIALQARDKRPREAISDDWLGSYGANIVDNIGEGVAHPNEN